MANIKHSKVKNTGLLFEFLVRQMSSDILNNKTSPASSIIQKYFSNTELLKEYLLYKAIYSSNSLSEAKADILINSVLTSYSQLDTKKIKESKYNLVKEIKAAYNEDEFFKSNVPSYRINATIYSLFELNGEQKSTNPNQLIQVRSNLLEHITTPPKSEYEAEWSKLDRGTKNATFKIMVENFNQSFKSFDSRQRAIINEYTKAINNKNSLRPVLNKTLLEVKKALIEQYKLTQDQVTKIKLKEIINNIVPITAEMTIKESDVVNTLCYCELLTELTNANEIS